MEQTTIKTEPHEQQPAAELRPWVTPTFEKVALDEALNGGLKKTDFLYWRSS